jgi:hypothetical protein
MTRGPQALGATVDRDTITGPEISLRRYGNKLRGTVGGEVTELRWQPGGDRVSGAFGDRPIELALSGSAGTLEISGWFGARTVKLRITPGALTGLVGPCRYELKFDDARYAGQVSCGGAPADAILQAPSTLSARPRAELAALLVAFLAI